MLKPIPQIKRLSLGLLAVIGAATLPSAGADVPWNRFEDAWLQSNGGHTGDDNPFTYHEQLINGGFESGGLAGWRLVTALRPPEWHVVSGTVGQHPFGSSDGSYFATVWPTGGAWPAGSVSILDQQAGLSPTHTGEALVRFEAIWAYDAIAMELDWVDASGGLLERVELGDFGGRPGVGNEAYRQVVPIPAGATGFVFRGLAQLKDGSWIDSGFDHASVVIATPIPEPASGAALAAALLLLRRRR